MGVGSRYGCGRPPRCAVRQEQVNRGGPLLRMRSHLWGREEQAGEIMGLHFDANLDLPLNAINTVVRLFEGAPAPTSGLQAGLNLTMQNGVAGNTLAARPISTCAPSWNSTKLTGSASSSISMQKRGNLVKLRLQCVR
jgi:hypothetical protein